LNVVFAQVGMQLGSDRLTEYAARFGIGRAVEFELPTASGQLASHHEALRDPASLAATSFGQGELLVTPLHMAMVMSAIANGGAAMRPLLVDAVLDEDGVTVTSTRPSVARTPISAESAATALDLLYDSVTYGYASGAQITDLRVAGKTGTAESGREAPHGWFIGSAGVNEPVVTVAVCLDFGGEGGGRALQIGRALLDAAITR
jgi:peptidoglycan glycosyltransferase